MTTRIRRGVRQTVCDGVSCRASAFDSDADDRWRAGDGRRDYHLCPRCTPAWKYADRLDHPRRGPYLEGELELGRTVPGSARNIQACCGTAARPSTPPQG